MKISDNFDINLAKILEKVVYDSDLSEKIECAEDIEDIYKICKELGYNQDICNFKKQIMEIVSCVQEISDENLEKVSGGRSNLQKTCAILLTAVNVGSPFANATNASNGPVSVQKQKNVTKFDAVLSKTNNYIRRGFKQISEFAGNNPKTTAGVSLLSVVSVPAFVLLANKLFPCIENSMDASENREEQVKDLFKNFHRICEKINKNPSQYYKESRWDFNAIKQDEAVRNFLNHAKHIGFNVSIDIFNFSSSDSEWKLNAEEVIGALKRSTEDARLKSVVDDLFSRDIENIKKIKINSNSIKEAVKAERKRKEEEEEAQRKAEAERKRKEEEEKSKARVKENICKFVENKEKMETVFIRTYCRELIRLIVKLSKDTNGGVLNVNVRDVLRKVSDSEGEKYKKLLLGKIKKPCTSFNYDVLKIVLNSDDMYNNVSNKASNKNFLTELLTLGLICNYLFDDEKSFEYKSRSKPKWSNCLENAQKTVEKIITGTLN